MRGALQPPEKHTGKGSGCVSYGWKASYFPMKGRRRTEIEIGSGQPAHLSGLNAPA